MLNLTDIGLALLGALVLLGAAAGMGFVLYVLMSRLSPIQEPPPGAEIKAAPAPEVPPKPVDERVLRIQRERRAAAYRRGILVLVALAVLTALEFLISLALGSLVLLFIAALAKAGIILQYFMHLSHVWNEDVKEVLT